MNNHFDNGLPIGDSFAITYLVSPHFEQEAKVTHQRALACAVRTNLPPIQGCDEDLFAMLFRCSDS